MAFTPQTYKDPTSRTIMENIAHREFETFVKAKGLKLVGELMSKWVEQPARPYESTPPLMIFEITSEVATIEEGETSEQLA